MGEILRSVVYEDGLHVTLVIILTVLTLKTALGFRKNLGARGCKVCNLLWNRVRMFVYMSVQRREVGVGSGHPVQKM